MTKGKKQQPGALNDTDDMLNAKEHDSALILEMDKWDI